MSQRDNPFNPEQYSEARIVDVDFAARILVDSNLKQNFELGILADYVERRDTQEFVDAFNATDVLMRRYGEHFRASRDVVAAEAEARLEEDLPSLNTYLKARPGCLIVSDDKYRHYIEKRVIGVQKIEATISSIALMGFVTEDEVLRDTYYPRCDVTKLSAPEQRLLSFYL